MLDLLSGVGNFVLFIIALGVIIFVHELGHFLTAKWVGVRVRRFAVGLGKPAISWRKGVGLRVGSSTEQAEKAESEGRSDIGETEYCLCYVPLGGYVAMEGQEDVGADEASDDPRSFANKPIWQRMIVISAGVVMNIIFAVLFFIVAFMIGVRFPASEVGMVQFGSPAAEAKPLDADVEPGLRPGDRIVSVNDERIADFTELKVAVALASPEAPARVTVERPSWGEEPARTLRFEVARTPGPQGLPTIGVTQPFARKLPEADRLNKQQRQAMGAELADWAGLRLGMTLDAVDGRSIESHWQYLRAVDASGGRPMKLTFRDRANQAGGGEATTVEVLPNTELQVHQPTGEAATPAGGASAHLMGLVPPVRISGVVAESAADGKLRRGDLIAAIGDFRWPSTQQVSQAVGTAGDQPLKITVLRDGVEHRVEVTPKRQGGMFGRRLLGIRFGQTQRTTIAAGWVEGEPLAALGAMAGSRIRAIAGQPVDNLNQLRRALLAAGPGSVAVDYTVPLLGGDERSGTIELTEAHVATLKRLPWRDPIMAFQTDRDLQKASGPISAMMTGLNKTWTFLKQVYMTLLGLAQQTISPKHLSGPVGITAIGTKMADQGMSYLFWFAGLISVNLAVVNFLPLPIVDGGLFVMLIIEKLRGKPLPTPVQSAISMAGIVLLAAVFIFVTYNDIVRLVGG